MPLGSISRIDPTTIAVTWRTRTILVEYQDGQLIALIPGKRWRREFATDDVEAVVETVFAKLIDSWRRPYPQRKLLARMDELIGAEFRRELAEIARLIVCPDCRGTGRYVGLITIEPCATCDGTGRCRADR